MTVMHCSRCAIELDGTDHVSLLRSVWKTCTKKQLDHGLIGENETKVI